MSVSLSPDILAGVDRAAKRHGVNRSQIIYDAIQAYEGKLQEELMHLRHELESQEETVTLLKAALDRARNETVRLQSSQELVDAILNPYMNPGTKLSKIEKEKGRTLRAILKSEESRRVIELLAEGEIDRPTLPLHNEAVQAWGSWEAIHQAVQTALEQEANHESET